MKTLVFGATAGIGREVVRLLAAKGHSLIIIARDPEDLAAEASHCRLSYGVEIDTLVVDAADPEAVHDVLSRCPSVQSTGIDNVIFTLGASAEDDQIRQSAQQMTHLLHVNFTSIMVAVDVLLPHMHVGGGANIVGLGSVAAARGRRSNVAYSAAKRALESYFESLRHASSGSGVNVQFYRLGYVDTGQTFGKRLLFPVVSPGFVARRIVENLDKDRGLTHLPWFWWGIVMTLRNLPWSVYRRLNF